MFQRIISSIQYAKNFTFSAKQSNKSSPSVAWPYNAPQSFKTSGAPHQMNTASHSQKIWSSGPDIMTDCSLSRDHRAVVCHDSLTSEWLKWQPWSQALSVLQSTCSSHNSAWNLSSATVLTLCCVTLQQSHTHLQNSLKLLLPRTPLHFGKMEISKQWPCIWVFIVDSQSLLEPVWCLIDLSLVTSHTAQSEITYTAVCKSLSNNTIYSHAQIIQYLCPKNSLNILNPKH